MSNQYQIGNYEETYKSFSLNVPDRYNWTYEVFDKWANDPQKIAMYWVNDQNNLNFRNLNNRILTVYGGGI